MVLVKHTPYLAGYKGPLSSKILENDQPEVDEEVPLLHFKESEGCFELEIDIPGLEAKNYKILVNNGSLVISSEILKTAGERVNDGKLKLSITRNPRKVKETEIEACSDDLNSHFTVL